VTASQLAMTAGAGIGAAGAIETAVGTLAAQAGDGTGNHLQVTNTGHLTIGSVTAFATTWTGVTTSAGAIDVSTTGNLTVDHAVSATGGNVTLAGGGSGSGAVITLNKPVTASGTVTVYGGAGADTIAVNVTGGRDIKVDGQDANDQYIVELGNQAAGAVNIEDSGATAGDRATLHGTTEDDQIRLLTSGVGPWAGVATLAGTPPAVVRFSGSLEFVRLNGGDGVDTFDVQPSPTAEITVDGGRPSFGLGTGEVPGPNPASPNPGDTLIFDPRGNVFSIVVNQILTEGGVPPFKAVKFVDIERVPLEPKGADTFRFDLNHNASSPTQSGYTAVLPGQLYTAVAASGTGYGWVGSGASGGVQRGAVASSFSDLIRDAHWGTAPRTFRVDVPDAGWYLVSVKLGDAEAPRDQMRVTNVETGQILLSSVTTATGQVREANFVVQASPDGTGGRIQLEFSDQGGDPYWMVSAIEVRPGEILNMGLAPQAGVADGATETTYTGVLATTNALVTVATTLGSILTADADPSIEGLQVLAEADGNFVFTMRHPSGAGQAVLTFSEVTGAKTGIATIDYSLPTLRRFDFNDGNSPTQAPVNASPDLAGVRERGGYIGVQPGQTYTADRGHGWEQSVGALDRGALSGERSDLRRDAHWGTSGVSGRRVFRVDLPDSSGAVGDYFVHLTLGDVAARDQVQIRNADTNDVLAVVDTAAGQYGQVHFATTVAGGRLRLEFEDLGGDPYWMVNGLEIRRAAEVLGTIAFTGSLGTKPADGVTVDVIAGTAPAALEGMLLTVTSTLGTILTDASPQYAGTQVLVGSGGVFHFDLRRSSVPGVPQFRAVAVDGSAEGGIGSATFLAYQGLPAWRFDMNHGSSPTQSPVASPSSPSGYVPVQGTTIYSSSLGYGWVTAPSGSLDRGALSSPTSSDLLRDSHWGSGGSGARTFQIDLPAGSSYEVTVTMGDTAARDQMAVTVVAGTGTGVTGINSAAGQYVHRT
ncbi:MAG: hypothetical protein MUF25_23040, partial [Pirellulaceae bacterium]|nr:hypothetical protein [Pirellulaceae bacterium]